ncbi:MAG: translation elongation factor 4 [Patescibacteria group bacterium]|nr:translation elongation factor 4 [Patescibacteria group bacterium]
MAEQSKIRNFSIIAHIDHGKSTLADRLLEYTKTVEKRKMKEQLLDTMELERERGITIKLQPARMEHDGYILNLIDTPGHIDFNYEVSRSLAAVEGALLLVDASQGVQAQTLGNLYLAMEQNLTIIPIINKIDLPNAHVEDTKAEIVNLLGCEEEEIILTSAKTGEGVEKILQEIIDKIPAPTGKSDKSPRAIIFDSKYDDYKGVVAFVRMVDGSFESGVKIRMLATKTSSEVLEVGYFKPEMVGHPQGVPLQVGEIGYIVTGLKDIEGCRVGDTITSQESKDIKPLPGYREVKPMVFAGLFPKEGHNYNQLREAMLKLKLSDAALSFEPERSEALGVGFRCGFLGLLHLEITKERLKREHNIELIITTPSVAYKIFTTDKKEQIIKSALDLPDPSRIGHIEEPWVKIDIITPEEHIGGIMKLVTEKRGEYKNTEYLKSGGLERVILHYELPLSAILVDFFDKLKSVSSGYASLNYEILDYRKANVVRMNILVAEEPIGAFASLVYRDEAYRAGRSIVKSLKEAIPRQMFEIKLQAAIGAKVIASERIPPMRKDVIAKLYGGDVTRKRKLLEKQKKGKKKMKAMGRGSVDIPTEAFLAVLKK